MKLRTKALIIILPVIISALLILWIIARIVILTGFAKVENQSVQRDIERVKDAIFEMENNLSVKAADWSNWDDTYQFITDSNTNYIKSNLNDESLYDLKLNLMFFMNNSHQVIFSRYYDLDSRHGRYPSLQIDSILSHDTLLSAHRSPESVIAGYYQLQNKILLLASRPIVKSSGQGPIRGTLIFGKFFDEPEINHLQKITHLTIDANFLSPELEKEFKYQQSLFTNSDSIIIKPMDKETIAGYAYIKGINKKPVFLYRIVLSRDIYKKGLDTYSYLLISLLSTSLILCIVIFILLEKLVLFRIRRLNYDVDLITKKSDHSLRVKIHGKDEIAEFSQSVNEMLSALQQKELFIENRNKEMLLLMDSIPAGLLSLNENFQVNPEYSKATEFILEQSNLCGKDFIELIHWTPIDLDVKQELYDYLDCIQNEVIEERELIELNPLQTYQFSTMSGTKWLRFHFYLIDRGPDLTKHILVVIENITEEIRLSERAQQSEQENLQLKAIAEDPDLFREFVFEMKQIVFRSEEIITNLKNDTSGLPHITEIFRNVHTIKGTAGTFGLSNIVYIASELEGKIEQIIKSTILTDENISLIKDSITQLHTAIYDIINLSKSLFGDDHNESDNYQIKISAAAIVNEYISIDSQLRTLIKDTQQYQQLKELIEQRFIHLRSQPANKAFAKVIRIINSTIQRSPKEIQFVINGGELLIDYEIARELSAPLIHLIRNCIDHGIETAEQRLAAGKQHQGIITMNISQITDFLFIEISDDGQGIDPDFIKTQAVERGFIDSEAAKNLTLQEVYEIILLPGFTTKESVTDLSGRGMGMNIVMTTIKDKLSGYLSIESKINCGSTFKIQIPYRPKL